MEHSMGSPNVSMIHFLIRTIPDGEIIRTYAMRTHLNKTIKVDSSIPMDFSPNIIIKWDSLLHLQIPMFLGLSSDDLREMMKTLQQNVMSFQYETRSSIHNLKKQMGQLALSVGKLEAQMNGKLSSQALNPKENVSVITLWSEKELEEQRSKQIEMKEEEEIEKKHPIPPQTKIKTNTPKVSSNSMNSSFKKIPPFLLSSSRSKKEDKEKEILEVFKKVELNIPLIDAIKQIPKYAKFLK